MNNRMNSEREQLFHDIGVIDFVIVEMTEYLDTHPTDGNGQPIHGPGKENVNLCGVTKKDYSSL